MRVKGWTKRPSEVVRRTSLVSVPRRKLPPPPPPPPLPPPPNIPLISSPRTTHLTVTTLHLLHPPSPSISDTEPEPVPPCLIAIAKSNANSTLHLYHPLTDKPFRHVSPLPKNLNLSEFDPVSLTVTVYSTCPYHKLSVFPELKNPNYEECSLLGLFHGGHFWGCSPSGEWRELLRDKSDNMFDDIAVFEGRVYVLDMIGTVYEVNITSFYQFTLGKTLVNCPSLSDLGWEDAEEYGERRMRLVIDGDVLYLVVRTEEKLFKVFMREEDSWVEIDGSDSDRVLFMGRDCYFFMDVTEEFPGLEYKGCIVFSEGAFPRCGTRSWSYECEDDIAVFRLSDEVFEKECDNGDSGHFPRINWTPPDWIFRELEADSDTKDGEVQSNLKNGELKSDLVGQDKEQEEMTSSSESSDIQDRDGKMQCDFNGEQNEDEEVTRTLLRMSSGNGQGTLPKNITQSIPIACTTKSHESDAVATKFEGLDVRSDLVPTLQMIWRNHGNIVENSSIRSGDIIARSLESLATLVRILEDNSAQSLSSSQADFLSSTLSDLRFMHFKVNWLIPYVEKVVKLHKSKHLVDSLNSLIQLNSQVKKRKASLIEELTKIGEEQTKLKEEITKVSNMIPFLGQVEFDKPVGSGLT